MRYILCFFILLSASYVNSQQQTVNDDAQGMLFQMKNITSDAENAGANDGSYKGTYLLFDDWENSCTIQILGKKYTLNRINFNVQNNEFMYKTDEKKISTIGSKHIDFIRIKNKVYKYQLYKDENKFFEVLYESKVKLSLFRGYNIRILPKSELGMLNRPYDEVKKDEKFYVLSKGELVHFKLKKKEFLSHIDKDKQGEMLKYMKQNGLSYKKDKDLIEILKYYDTI